MISDDILKIYSFQLEESVRKRLKSRNDTFSLMFPSDIYIHTFESTKEKLAEKVDFEKLRLSDNWDTLYRDNGVGVALKFPVRVTPVIKFTNNFVPVNGLAVNRKYIMEKIRVTSATRITFA